MNNFFIIPIEPIETRYTKHWFKYLPLQFNKNLKNCRVRQIAVPFIEQENTDGAFFNFATTMAYKSKQAEVVANLFVKKEVQDGDIFFFTDFWNPTVHNIRYMADLLDIKVKIMGICHAGAYDPADLLGQKFKNKNWADYLEKSFIEVYDTLFFATNFSCELFEKKYGVNSNKNKNKITGFPMEYYDKILTPYWDLKTPPPKENIILFPHRKSLEKNLEVFLAIKELLPEYKFIVTLDECKTKEEYHNLLYRSKLCFSASLQETLGISMGLEALRCGCDVLVPDRLSYKEMWFPISSFYDQENEQDKMNPSFLKKVSEIIKEKIEKYDQSLESIKYVHEKNFKNYFSGDSMYNIINQELE